MIYFSFFLSFLFLFFFFTAACRLPLQIKIVIKVLQIVLSSTKALGGTTIVTCPTSTVSTMADRMALMLMGSTGIPSGDSIIP